MRRMRFKADGSEQALPIGISRGHAPEATDYLVEIDGRKIDVEATLEEDGHGWIRLHGRMHQYYVTNHGRRFQVWLNGRSYSFEMHETGARRAGQGVESGSVRGDVTAPMPGTILKVNVAAGQHFEAHAPLVIMESMKMEMTLTAPHDGRVKDVLCKVGQLVEMGAVLVRLHQ